MISSFHSLLCLWLLLFAVCCFWTVDAIDAVVVNAAAADDSAAAALESALQQSSLRRKNKLRQLQFLPGDLCRCEASWEDFYPEFSSAQQQEPQRAKYPGVFDNGGDRRGRRNHRGLQHYDYDTQEESENGLVVVEDIFILPPIDPFCISLGAQNRRHSRDLLGGVAIDNVPLPETESETVTTTSTRSPSLYNRGNGRLEILIGAARSDGEGTSSATTISTNNVRDNDEPKAADNAAGEERDLVNCHGAHLETATGYRRRNPYNRRPANSVYGVQNQRPGRYWANRPSYTASSSNVGIYGTKIMGIGKGTLKKKNVFEQSLCI
jgi:hypothetical protein